VRGAIVHHSATDGSYQPGDVPAMLRAIQAFHQDVRGWVDIGYNAAIDAFGGIWEARAGGIDRAVVGAHAGGFNTRTFGVVVLGDFSVAQPSAPALGALEDVLAWKLFLHHSDPAQLTTLLDRSGTPAGLDIFNLPSIIGHRDVNDTACPGTVESYLPAIRAAVTARVAAAAAPGTPPRVATGPPVPHDAVPVVGDYDGDGASDLYWYGNGHGDQFWYGGPGGFVPATPPTTVPAGRVGVVGDYDGDGRADLYWYDRNSPVALLWYGREGHSFDVQQTGTVLRTTPHVGDFDGNGSDDLLFYGGTDHDDYLVLTFRDGLVGRPVEMPDDVVVVVGDLDGDTRDDVLLHHPWGGPEELWRGADDAVFSPLVVPAPAAGGTVAPVVADLDGDHAQDIVWLDGAGAGTVSYGRTFALGTAPLAGATTVVAADVTGGGTSDLVVHRAGGSSARARAGVDRTFVTEPLDAPHTGTVPGGRPPGRRPHRPRVGQSRRPRRALVLLTGSPDAAGLLGRRERT
jgi:hypothetical protein